MSARFGRWLKEWDWRPLARMIVWLAIVAAAAERSGFRPPALAVVVRELALGWLLSFGLLTWLQIRLAMGAWWLFMALDDWTYAASERLVRPVVSRAPFAVGFLVALAAQIALVFGAIGVSPRVLTSISTWL